MAQRRVLAKRLRRERSSPDDPFCIEGDCIIPPDIEEELRRAETPEQMSLIIQIHEARLAQWMACPTDPYLYCDHTAELMTQALEARGIPHLTVVGTSDEGSAHAYVIVNDTPYDPTNQGFGDGKVTHARIWPGNIRGEWHPAIPWATALGLLE